MKKLFLFLMLATASFAFSQAQLNASSQRVEFFSTNKTTIIKEAKGSPYVSNDFLTATISGFEGTYKVRYNANSEQMEVKMGGSVKVVPTSNVQAVTIPKTFKNPAMTYVPTRFEDGKEGFALNAWQDGKGNYLLIRETVQYYPAKQASNSYGKDKAARYERENDQFYLKSASGNLTKIPSKKKQFFSAFKGKEGEIKDFVKKEKLKISDTNDLKKIAAFYFK